MVIKRNIKLKRDSKRLSMRTTIGQAKLGSSKHVTKVRDSDVDNYLQRVVPLYSLYGRRYALNRLKRMRRLKVDELRASLSLPACYQR